MHRFYFPELQSQSGEPELTENEAQHAIRVLRIQPNDIITLLDGKGTRSLGKITSVTKGSVRFNIQNLETSSPRPIHVTLFQSVTKTKSMDWIVEKATELGVDVIQPILTERSISRLDGSDSEKKLEKWMRTAIESLKQCGGFWLPRILSVKTLSQSLDESSSFQTRLFASLSPDATELKDADLGKPSKSILGNLRQIGLWVGPEGDFSLTEIQLLKDSEVIPFTLGRSVLRSETAATCALALINYELRNSQTGDGR